MTKSRDEEIEDAVEGISVVPAEFIHAALDEGEKQIPNPLKIKERRAHILGAVFGFGWQTLALDFLKEQGVDIVSVKLKQFREHN